jgi:hypothetical protein
MKEASRKTARLVEVFQKPAVVTDNSENEVDRVDHHFSSYRLLKRSLKWW